MELMVLTVPPHHAECVDGTPFAPLSTRDGAPSSLRVRAHAFLVTDPMSPVSIRVVEHLCFFRCLGVSSLWANTKYTFSFLQLHMCLSSSKTID